MIKLVFECKLLLFSTLSRPSAKDMYLAQAGKNLDYSLDIETRLRYDVMTLLKKSDKIKDSFHTRS